jgi:DNA-binding ferritin-like protein
MKISISENFELATNMTPINVMGIGDFSVYDTESETVPSVLGCDPLNAEQNCDCPECRNMYENLEALGFVFLLASNDIHTIHINAKGKDFTRLHIEANEVYDKLNEFGDTCLEMSVEDGHFIHSINGAKEIVSWDCPDIGQRGYNLVDGVNEMIRILDGVATSISELYNDVSSDIQSTLDEWLRYIDSKKNYFLGRILQESRKRRRRRNESIMSASVRNARRNRNALVKESLDHLELGKCYKDFYMVEDHIDIYDCDTADLKKGDYIIRDFQFGHLPNGGNKGYIPYRVEDIVYERDEDTQGFWDSRKRLHLYDGEEDFYLDVYMERFNGMFHKLKKSSVKE